MEVNLEETTTQDLIQITLPQKTTKRMPTETRNEDQTSRARAALQPKKITEK